MPRIYKSAEQAMFLVVILALQLNHEPVKSSTLSELLMVSDSYLKKVIRKLSEGKIVTATTGPGGGVCLARPADQITLGDICRAVEENPWGMTVEDMKTKALVAREGASQSIFSLAETLTQAGAAFDTVLNGSPISDHLPKGSWENGHIDWNAWWEKNKATNGGRALKSKIESYTE